MNSNNHILGTFKEVWEVLLKLGYQQPSSKIYKIIINDVKPLYYEEIYEKLCQEMTGSFWSNLRKKMDIRFSFEATSDSSFDISFEGLTDTNETLFLLWSNMELVTDPESGDTVATVGEVYIAENNSQEDSNDLLNYFGNLVESLRNIDPELLKQYFLYIPQIDDSNIGQIKNSN